MPFGLTGRSLLPTRVRRITKSGRPDLNRRSRAPEARGIPGFPTSCHKSAQRESNPHFRHGKAAGCRYIMGALDHRCAAVPCAGLSKTKSTGRDSNPRRRITGAESSPLDDPCLSVGPVGIEPTSSGLRDRRITVSATVPCSRRGRSRTFDLTLIRGPLSPLSYAPLRVGPKGLEPSRSGLKVRCAAVTPRPHR